MKNNLKYKGKAKRNYIKCYKNCTNINNATSPAMKLCCFNIIIYFKSKALERILLLA